MIQLVITRHRQGDGPKRATVMTVGPGSRVTGTDGHLLEVLGYHPQDVEGRPLKLLVASPEDNPLCGDYASYHQNGKPFTVTLRHGRGYFMAATVQVQVRETPADPVPEPATAVSSALPVSPGIASDQPARTSHTATRLLLAHIRHSLDQDENLPLFCQTIEPLQNAEEMLQFEVLARLPSPTDEGFLLTPADFLPVAEHFQLARRLDRRVIRQVVCNLLKHPQTAGRLRYVGFNLSLGSLEDKSFPVYLKKVLEKTGLPAEIFCFELPARHAVRHPEAARYLCRAVSRLGCRTALDGTGSSIESFRLAGRLPVDYIKLAPALMGKLHEEPSHQMMIEAIQRIARNSGKSTIATNVENDIARSRARSFGLDYVQGCQVARPVPLRTLLRDGPAPAQQEVTAGA